MTWATRKGITRFDPEEFPEDPERYSEVFFLKQLNEYAVVLGCAVFPSPVTGALARFDGSKTSCHYAVNRQSNACDVFCNCSIAKAFFIACCFFTGIGVYFDTKYRNNKWPMLHLDTRESGVIWYREDGKYFYPSMSITFYADLAKKLSMASSMCTSGH